MAHAPHQLLFQVANRNYDVFNLHSDLGYNPNQNANPGLEDSLDYMSIPEETDGADLPIDMACVQVQSVNPSNSLNSNDLSKEADNRHKDAFWDELQRV